MKTLSRFLVDHAAAVLAPKQQQSLFHHVRLPTTTPYHSDLHWYVSTTSRRIFRCAPPVAAATAVPPPAQLGRRSASRIRLSHHRSARFLCVRDQLEVGSSVAAIFSSRPNRVALFAWARTPTCLLSSSTTGVAAPDLVGRRSRPRCKSTP